MRRTTAPVLAMALLAATLVTPGYAAEEPCAPEEAPAAQGFWRPTYAPGTNWANDIAFDATGARILIAGVANGGSPGGPYLSSDGGQTWSRGRGAPESSTTVEFSPADPSVLYASASATFYRSVDGGGLWCPAADFPASAISILVDDRAPDTVWAGLTNGTVMRSFDRGITWSEGGTGLPNSQPVYDLLAGPTPSDLLAMTRNGAFRSTDGGATFTSSGSGMHANPGASVVAVVDGAQPATDRRTVYAVQPVSGSLATGSLYVNSTYGYNASGHLYKSTDFGATWQDVPQPTLPSNGDRTGGSKCALPRFAGVTVAPSGALVGGGFCGVFTSRDGGLTWTFLTEVPGSARVAQMETSPTGEVWGLSDGQGVFLSRDNGRSFERVAALGWAGSMLPDAGNTCTAEALGGGRLIASCGLNRLRTGFHTIASSDAGRTWSAVRGLRESHVLHFAAAPKRDGVVMAATKTEGFWRSVDHGKTWGRLAWLPPNALAVASAASTTSTFYAVGTSAQAVGLTPIYGESAETTLWRSRDAGATWSLVSALPAALPYSLEVSPHDPTVLFVGGWAEPFASTPVGGLFRSTDEGATWARVATVPADHTTNAIGFVAGSPEVVLVSADTLYRSTDGGETFGVVGDMPQNQYAFPRSFAAVSGLASVVYHGSEQGLFRSADAGATWEPWTGGLEAHGVDEGSRAVFEDPDDPKGVYLLAGGYAWAWGTRFSSYGRYLLHGREA